MMFLVTIHDKELYGEPDIALAVVEAPSEGAALRRADPIIEDLIEKGRCRCVAMVRQLDPGRFYRLGAVIRLPRDANMDVQRD
jgi:hypothetical protein